MREILFHNTLTSKTEPFVPLHAGEARIYTCGPTVYNFAHIGNYRTFVFQDVLRRFLRSQGYRVNQVMNLTDVDDRIIERAAAAHVSIREFTDPYIQAFLQDREILHLEKPERLPRATGHINEMVRLIETLTAKGYTYEKDGSIYFRIAKFPRYGQLSKIDLSGIQAGARVDVDRYDKADARDFALWKAPKPGEEFWTTPIGKGRPGWHIECSAMAMLYLGETIDIHSGGIDLAFPHHENEIAQSEAATGKTFARYWLHAEHLLVDSEKMSKSLGNFSTLRDLLKEGYKPSSLRFLLASVPYGTQLNFTLEGLQQAASSVERLRTFADRLARAEFPAGTNPAIAQAAANAMEKFEAALANDLNTAQALAAVFDLLREANIAMDRGEFRQNERAAVGDAFKKVDAIFAVLTNDDAELMRTLGLGRPEGPADAEIEALVAKRQEARKRRDFKEADRIRKELSDRGIILEDTSDGGIRWKRK
ncbi:MAG TPA: cysteine--tRNA ligase [Methylomirabilota bacterium]|nr:cysteine--tRNA ligase [Methylomirabilota bacterium]